METKNKVFIIILLVLLFSTLNASAISDNNNANNASLLLLKAGYIDTGNVPEPEEKTSGSQTMGISTLSGKDAEKYYIVQFTGPVQEAWKQNITSKGASIYNYVPNNAFVFRMCEDVKNQVYSLDFVDWIGEYKPSYKYEPKLADNKNVQLLGLEPETKNTYRVLIFSSTDNERITNDIESLGGNILSSSGNVFKIQTSSDKLADIASINDVKWIEEYIQPKLTNNIAAGIINVDTIHETYGLNGNGQIVAVCDSGLDIGVNNNSMHADIRGRILSITDVANDGSSADQSGHGTHVVGSVLGNGSLSGGLYSGMAPEAELVFQAAGDSTPYIYLPDNLSELFQPAYDLGARIHTNSWGGDANGDYTIMSQQVDQFMWEHPDMLILFSAGNSGKDANSNGVIDNDSIGEPGTAKNCLTVGASENERGDTFNRSPYLTWGTTWNYSASPLFGDYMANNREGMAAFSSRGPTDDGRVKPEVVAPGTFIASTRSSVGGSSGWGIINDTYLYMGGTSMSTPITAGSAAIVRQYYTDVENLSSPSAALLKATLINGAYNMAPGQYGTGATQEILGRPDYSQGWGRIDIANSIYSQYPKVIRYFDNIPLNYSESWNVSYYISGTSEPLRATLVWTDYPGDASVVTQLVNNLDLTVIGPEDTYYGNDGTDTINNIEGVELVNPFAGTYTIIVNGTNVPQGPQNFSIVISYETVDSFPVPDSYITNSTTAVSMNLTHSDGINSSSINMTIDGSHVTHSLENIDGGYLVQNLTAQPYSDGYHNTTVSAMTNLSELLTYSWRFYVSTEENIITVQGLGENDVIQENTFDIIISSNKLCDFMYNVDNGANSTEESVFSFNTTFNLSEGRHNLTIFAEDVTGYTNLTTVNFTVFNSQPAIDSPTSGTIYYLPDNTFVMNGTAGIATNVSVYVNGVITNVSCPVSDGMFNISNIPLSNGTNTVDVTSIFNNSLSDYFSPNITLYLSLGETFNTNGDDEVTLLVPGFESNISYPTLNFNITGTSANPGNISASSAIAEDPESGSYLTGPAIDIRVLNGSDADYSYQFGRNVSLTLGYNHSLVHNTGKLAVAWYDPDEGIWIPFRSTVNISAHTVTANITHLSIYVPLEDNTAPVISNLTNSSSSAYVTLTWESSSDTDHVEIWRNGAFLENNSNSHITDTGLSSVTSYIYSLKPVDFVGNIGNWSNMTVTTSTQTTVISTSSGGGGGGGGGGSTGEDLENIAFKDVLSVYTAKDEIVDFDFDSENNDIEYIRYTSLRNAGKISTTIEILKNTSTFVDNAPSGLIYRNMNVWIGKTGYATENNIKDPVIGFKVSKKWVLDNDIDPSTIVLKRYSDDTWQMLDTKQTDPDDNYLYFEASTPGFSVFAITAEEPLITDEKEKTGITVMELDGSTLMEDITDSNTSTADNNEREDNGKLPAVSGITTMLILAIACVLVRK
ncbi:PGF-pre-PGF domain-containing protein [Methanolobus psychrotolerans]|uniref:PGF-pre-PGF domain-containing protein n=1 Tax=Methanolobus psychrotolerans TaxID=1874706 RepID=UPI0013ED2C57|nr:PGF-pre-PGF domain-containing protein [Methanolobus psychrotolerans]